MSNVDPGSTVPPSVAVNTADADFPLAVNFSAVLGGMAAGTSVTGATAAMVDSTTLASVTLPLLVVESPVVLVTLDGANLAAGHTYTVTFTVTFSTGAILGWQMGVQCPW